MSIIILSLCACAASVVNTKSANLNRSSSYLIYPFKNFTQTPDAGLRVASILYGVLLSKNFKVAASSTLGPGNGEVNAAETLAGMLQEAKNNGFKFIITGNVNEFRYKTGINGEPAVSVTVLVYDSKNGEVIWSSTGSATGWSSQSRTTVAQKLLNKIIVTTK